jgi:hypothetical protein
MFCEYSTILGKVNQGIHRYRFFNLAIMDVLMTFIGSYFLQKIYFKKYSYIQVTIGLFLLGIILHRIFCVRTTIDKLLFN